MKKWTLLLACAAMVLMTACEGDDPAGPGGTMPTVTGLAVDWAASDGVDVVLDWDAVTDAEGYKVYFRATSSGTWSEVEDVTGTTATHTAPSAGYYVVTAYNGDDTSENYSNEVNTMPTIISAEYTIYDNFAPADWHSGFIFGFDGGQTGLAGSSAFVQDIYAYDPDTSPSVAWLYSGDTGTFGDGNHTEMADGGSTPGAAPSSGYWTSGWVQSGDVIFCELFDGFYAKMIISDVSGPVGGSTNGTGITFTYEIQEQEGIRLFTTNS